MLPLINCWSFGPVSLRIDFVSLFVVFSLHGFTFTLQKTCRLIGNYKLPRDVGVRVKIVFFVL